MKKTRISVTCVVLTVLTSAIWAHDLSANFQATKVANDLVEAMGGREILDSIRLLQFDFVVSRDGAELSRYKHWWDRSSGDYRLEGVTREESLPYRVLFNVNTKEGRAWKGNEELQGEELASQLEHAYGRFINDTYWFMMPWKWLDPGVHLTYEGEKNLGDRSFDVVKLNFDDGTGLTSQDVYWAYVSKDTGLMERWEYVLQTDDGLPGAKEPTVWEWMDWQELPVGIKVAAPKRRVADGPEVIISTPVHRADSTITDDEMREIMYPAPLVTEGDS